MLARKTIIQWLKDRINKKNVSRKDLINRCKLTLSALTRLARSSAVRATERTKQNVEFG